MEKENATPLGQIGDGLDASKDAEAEIRRLHSAGKEAELSWYEGEIVDYRDTLKQLTRELADKERQAAQMEKEAIAEVDRLEAEIARLKAHIADSEDGWNTNETDYLTRIADLQDNLAVLKALTTNDWTGVTCGMVSQARRAGFLPTSSSTGESRFEILSG